MMSFDVNQADFAEAVLRRSETVLVVVDNSGARKSR